MPTRHQRPRFSLRVKAIASIVLLLCMFLATFLFYTVDSHHLMVEEMMQRDYGRYAGMLATTLEHALREGGTEAIEHYLDRTVEDPAVQYVVLTDGAGNMVYAAGKEAQSQMAAERRTDAEHEEHEHGIREIGSPAGFFHMEGHLFDIARPVAREDAEEWILRLGISTAEMNQAVAATAYRSTRLILAALLIGGLLVGLVDRQIKQILRRLITTTQAMAAGDLSQRVQIKTGDALEVLGRSFNVMADALSENEKRFQDVANNALAWTWEVDPEGKYTYASPVVSKVLGYQPAELLEKHFYDLFHPDDRESLKRAAFEAFAERRGFRELLNRNVHRDGRDVWLSTSGVPIIDEKGNFCGYRGADTDITERKKIEEAFQKHLRDYNEQLQATVAERTRQLEDEKNKLQIMLNNVPSAFLMIDPAFGIESASTATQRVLGKEFADIQGRFCGGTLCGRSPDQPCPVHRALKSGQVETVIHQVPGADEDRYLERTAVPIRKNGDIHRVLEIITDVTAKKHLEDQLVRSEKLATTGEMAAVLAHEMRNSLTSVKMILQLQLEEQTNRETDQEPTRVALDSIARMETLVNHLLQFARPSIASRRPGDLNGCLRASLEVTQPHWRDKAMDLRVELDAALPSILFDPEMMREVFVNLLVNAGQAIETAGRITVRSGVRTLQRGYRDYTPGAPSGDTDSAGPHSASIREIFLSKGSRVLSVVGEDTGRGIARKDRDRIFDPFFTTKINGTGLGLSLVKRHVNAHNGVVTVDSKLRKGTRFEILLPLVDEEFAHGA